MTRAANGPSPSMRRQPARRPTGTTVDALRGRNRFCREPLQNRRAFHVDPLEHHLEFLDVGRDLECGRTTDVFLLEEEIQTVVEQLHAFFFSDSNRRRELL